MNGRPSIWPLRELNADPATPVSIKLGFDRDVVAVAPPIGGTVTAPATTTTASGQNSSSSDTSQKGTAPCTIPRASGGEESVSSHVQRQRSATVRWGSGYRYRWCSRGTGAAASATNAAAATTDQRHTWVHSRFASGGAALAIACAPAAVAAVMGFTPLTRLTDADLELLAKLSACVNAMNQPQLNELARTLDIFLSETEQRSEQLAKQEITGRFLKSDPEQLREYATTMKTTCPT